MRDVAIVGNADMYHVECAREVYGDDAVDTIMGDSAVDAAFSDAWPRDSEGNDLTCTHNESDMRDETGAPYSCGHCLGYLVEDESLTVYPISQAILNLTVDSYDSEYNRACSVHAEYSRKAWDHDTMAQFIKGTEDCRAMLVGCEDSAEYRATCDVLAVAAPMVRAYLRRDIVHLVEQDGTYWLADKHGMIELDERGEPEQWAEFDMRGYLDSIESACTSCGAWVQSHAYYAEWDGTSYYCPACVVIH